jgi:hypothetical protein
MGAYMSKIHSVLVMVLLKARVIRGCGMLSY